MNEKAETLHKPGDEDLHFRYAGTAGDREFVVNIEFGSSAGPNSEKLRPEEFDFMMVKVLGIILKRLAENPNPALH